MKIVSAFGSAWDILPLKEGVGIAAAHRLIYRFGARGFGDRIRMAAIAEDVSFEDLARLAGSADWSPPPFPVTGEEIKALGVQEGPKVGAVRRALEEWWIDGDFTATKAQALAELERIAPAFRTPAA